MPLFSDRSIKQKIQNSYIVIIILLTIAPVFVVVSSVFQTIRYDQIITNVSNANRLNQVVKIEISNEIWDIVAGKKSFAEGQQYVIIQQIHDSITEMIISSSVENRRLLEVALRTLNTLHKYVDILGLQIKNNALVAENEQILEEVRSVAGLIYDILQEFIVVEIESSALANESLKRSTWIFSIIEIIIVFAVIIFSATTQASVSESIRGPIRQLQHLSSQIASGNLSARATIPPVAELENLTQNLNVMAEKIQVLIADNILEQKNFQKAEMKALQAQITPHFLYNTLDSIIWLAETGKIDEVKKITQAFSTFFRISLSRGHEWISVGQEIEYVKSYLTIQKIRYRDILDYQIVCDSQITEYKVLKFILQPLVENALYHGIKNKREMGKLTVSCTLRQNRLFFSVHDNGIGIKPERLQEILHEINIESDSEDLHSVYGLYNVNKRLKLYYNADSQLHIESVYSQGTTVTFSVPAQSEVSRV